MAPRTATSQRSRFGRATAQPRSSRWAQRGPTPSNARQALSKLGGLRPGAPPARAGRPDLARVGKGSAGIALLAGAAGLALKKRDSVVATPRHDTPHPPARLP